jgi:glutaredoxin 3
MRYVAPFFLALMTLLVSAHAAVKKPDLPTVSTSPDVQPALNPDVVVYTIPGCMGCRMVISMFEDRGIPFKEINVAGNRSLYMAMVSKTGGKRTVPQVFINDKYIGGYSDINGADLDALVKSKEPAPASGATQNSEEEDG